MQLNSKDVFFALVRAGLWEKKVRLLPFGNIDFEEIFQLAQEQSVLGLVAAGLEHVKDLKIPKKVALQFVGQAMQLEQRNMAMNAFIGMLMERMRAADIYSVLVKGQGIAQCYERPLWRACGDVDLLLDSKNYSKAKKILIPLASSVEEEAVEVMHFGMTIDSWVVELHGSLRSFYLPQMDRVIDDTQNDVLMRRGVRTWAVAGIEVFVPDYNNDVFFVFTHILKHFFREGVGMRQICDWCRLLWTAREVLDNKLLEERLLVAGIMTEWKAFASYAVDYLAMPPEAMPLYSAEQKWSSKAARINHFVLTVGNFGNNRYRFSKEDHYLQRKTKALGRRVHDAFIHAFIFPSDSFKVFLKTVCRGLVALARSKK